MFGFIGDLSHMIIEAAAIYGVYRVGKWKGRNEKSSGFLKKFL